MAYHSHSIIDTKTGQFMPKYDLAKKEKYCPGCKEVKQFDAFHNDKSTSSGKSSDCRECIKLRQVRYRNKRKANGTSSLYYKRQDVRAYGITIEQFMELKNKQNNKCAICSGPPVGRGNNLHIDHDHKTKKVRGLLCHYCNVSLGGFKDSVSLLKKAIKYLGGA